MTNRVDIIRDTSGVMTIGGSAVIGAEKATTMQILSENAVAIGLLCTIITCVVFLITGALGVYFQYKSTETYIQKRIKKAMEDE